MGPGIVQELLDNSLVNIPGNHPGELEQSAVYPLFIDLSLCFK